MLKQSKEEMFKQRVLNDLPSGVSLGDLTPEIEVLRRSNKKWLKLAQIIDALPSTKVLRIDINGVNKGRINTIRQGIRTAWKELGIKKELRFSVDWNLNILNAWCN